MRAYERIGVREYWLIDPYGPVGTEFYQSNGTMFMQVQADEDGWLNSSALPNPVVDITRNLSFDMHTDRAIDVEFRRLLHQLANAIASQSKPTERLN